ncbi:MAG: hypothetical protein PHH49_07390 [Candidatus Omnitrophica bacterium]|nr:hypothetical protein [Candidatus Omnitrophota bacterium]MDD5488758.1 hypothetical protein [Candidatus Omnitrophota bacterium]
MLYIYGAGRQGRIVLSILREGACKEKILFMDDNLAGEVLGVEVIRSEDAEMGRGDGKVLAIGNDLYTRLEKKKELVERLRGKGGDFMPVIGGFVSWDVKVPDTFISHPGSVVMTGTKIGEFVIVSTNASIDHDNVLGDHVNIAPGVVTGGGVEIGAGTFVGLGAVVFPEVRIGRKCIIGAGSLVRKDVPDGMLVYGSPARTIRKAEK